MPAPLDLTGKRFGRLTALYFVRKSGIRFWTCRCDCGASTAVEAGHLRKGRTRSCGCLLRETTIERSTKHGLSSMPEYHVWKTMKSRCYNHNDSSYPYYGGRGITVCGRWLEDFAAFIQDMGPRPVGTSIDRVNNNGAYTPENCRWATHSEQMKNRRPWKKGRRAA